jgi:hypothetical protein
LILLHVKTPVSLELENVSDAYIHISETTLQDFGITEYSRRLWPKMRKSWWFGFFRTVTVKDS